MVGVGRGVGSCVVGIRVGVAEGTIVGSADGSLLGGSEGYSVGRAVGIPEDVSVGGLLG